MKSRKLFPFRFCLWQNATVYNGCTYREMNEVRNTEYYVLFFLNSVLSAQKASYSNKEVAINHRLLYSHLCTFPNSLNRKLYSAVYFFSLMPP